MVSTTLLDLINSAINPPSCILVYLQTVLLKFVFGNEYNSEPNH